MPSVRTYVVRACATMVRISRTGIARLQIATSSSSALAYSTARRSNYGGPAASPPWRPAPLIRAPPATRARRTHLSEHDVKTDAVRSTTPPVGLWFLTSPGYPPSILISFDRLCGLLHTGAFHSPFSIVKARRLLRMLVRSKSLVLFLRFNRSSPWKTSPLSNICTSRDPIRWKTKYSPRAAAAACFHRRFAGGCTPAIWLRHPGRS